MTPPTRPIHHVGYFVDDIPAAVNWAVTTLGAGPFFVAAHITFDEVTYLGEPAAYDQTSAFGQWGPIKLELTAVHSAAPAGLAAALAGPTPRIGHVAWLASDLEKESSALSAAGAPLFHTAGSGPVRGAWHDARATLGHDIEVLQECPEILGVFELIRSSAADWDGSGPLREVPG
jgi:catechol 2,3-dioxygenase-like lactoylglutathione lyase family enzyme